jgi:hypothetical protein
LGLLLHRAEHNADPAFAPARLDERQDVLVPEAGRLGLHRGDVARRCLCVSGAWDGAHRDAVVDAALQLRALLADAGAGKSAAPARDGRALDAFRMALPAVPLVQAQPDAAALCKPDAVPFAGQSCAGPALAELPEVRDEVCSEPMGSQFGLTLKSLARLAQAEPPPPQVAEVAQPRDGTAALRRQAEPEARMPVVSQPQGSQS